MGRLGFRVGVSASYNYFSTDDIIWYQSMGLIIQSRISSARTDNNVNQLALSLDSQTLVNYSRPTLIQSFLTCNQYFIMHQGCFEYSSFEYKYLPYEYEYEYEYNTHN